jgi:hypothetical protein
MKIPRSLKHRDFSVEQAGYFNVLRPSARFIASGLQRRFPYLMRLSKEAHVEPFQVLEPTWQDRGGLRLALIVLAAAASTCAALWMIGMVGGFSYR